MTSDEPATENAATASISRLARIQADMQALAGRLHHRLPNSTMERAAAEYVHERLKGRALTVEMDDFYSIDNPFSVFASYYAEFVIVSLVAIWWPHVALFYGGGVFLVYLAEFAGYRVISRFVPHFETQNVVARFLAARPRCTIVVMAHLDSGVKGALMRPVFMRCLPWLHRLVLVCMLIVVASCAVEAIHGGPSPDSYEPYVRWAAVCLLLVAAGIVSVNQWLGEPTRGANDNASGVAALLSIADRLAESPLETADVHLVATGANRTWMSGARQFVDAHGFDPAATYYLNLDQIGNGTPCYTVREGMLVSHRCGRDLLEAAQQASTIHNAAPRCIRTASWDSLIPLARGYQTLSVTGSGAPEPYDRLVGVEYPDVVRATDFAEDIIRRLVLTVEQRVA